MQRFQYPQKTSMMPLLRALCAKACRRINDAERFLLAGGCNSLPLEVHRISSTGCIRRVGAEKTVRLILTSLFQFAFGTIREDPTNISPQCRPKVAFGKPVSNLSVAQMEHSFMSEANQSLLGLRWYNYSRRLQIGCVQVETIPTGYVRNSLQILEECRVTSLFDHPIFNRNRHRFFERGVRRV